MTGRGRLALLLAAVVVAAAGTAFHFATATHVATAGRPPASTRRAVSAVSLPLFFEPNQGQTDPQVRFLARGAGYGLFLTANEAVLELQQTPSPFGSGQAKNSRQPSAVSLQPSADNVIRMRLDGANSSARVSGAEPLPGKSNYFIGNNPAKWHRNIPQFARVNYTAVYPGVDLVYYGNQGQIEYDFRVAPGADPSQIVLDFDGASARLDSGNLVLSTGQGDLLFHAPQIYQQEGNSRKTIAGNFRQLAGNKIGFALGAYDHSRELVIDPVLNYSTYLGRQRHRSRWCRSQSSAARTSTSPGQPPRRIFRFHSGRAPSRLSMARRTSSSPNQPVGDKPAVIVCHLPRRQWYPIMPLASRWTTVGSIYVAGTTTSPDFPTSTNAFQTSAAQNPSARDSRLSQQAEHMIGNHTVLFHLPGGQQCGE